MREEGSVKEKTIIIISHDEKHSIKIVSKIDDRLRTEKKEVKI